MGIFFTFFPSVMFRVSRNVTSATDQFYKSLTDFFLFVLGTGVISVMLFIQESFMSQITIS